MKQWARKQTGFTIVELLIVIVVIAILATITIVAYNGIQNRTYDTAIQSDLNSIGKQILSFEIRQGRLPQGNADLGTLDIKATKSAYGVGMLSGAEYYNLVYCWANPSDPTKFTLVAQSKSNKVFEYVEGKVREAGYGYTGGSMGICQNSGVTLVNGSARDWFYSANIWHTYVKG